MSIPKIIHQLWIGPKLAPTRMMDTWRDKNPDFEYIRWTEDEIKARNIEFVCQNRIDEIEEINGKADIMRWELLARFGGVFIDADSICIEPIDHNIMFASAFASFENEAKRGDLVATGTMGFPPNHALPNDAIRYIKDNPVSQKQTGKRAWQTVGPLLLTSLLKQIKYADFVVFPSHYFLPIHFCGEIYKGHEKVYAYQEWGSTKENYEVMNSIELPAILLEPKLWVSVLMPFYNTSIEYLVECIYSIRQQIGHFGIELVIVDDGSDYKFQVMLRQILVNLQISSRFMKIVLKTLETNEGPSSALREGVLLCSNELIFRMDCDDIMLPNRMIKQLEFMEKNPSIVMCGTDIAYFGTVSSGGTEHPSDITWENYIKTKSPWIMNGPTLCFRKGAVLEVGNFTPGIRIGEDLDLELRLLKKFKKLANIPEKLLKYRISPTQATSNMTQKDREKTREMIQRIVSSE